MDALFTLTALLETYADQYQLDLTNIKITEVNNEES